MSAVQLIDLESGDLLKGDGSDTNQQDLAAMRDHIDSQFSEAKAKRILDSASDEESRYLVTP